MAGVFATSFWTPDMMLWLFVTPWLTAGTAGTVLIASAFWEGEVSSTHRSSDRTHVKDPKSIFEAQPPGRDLLFAFLRVQAPRDPIPFIPLGQVPLNICYGPAIKSNLMNGLRYASLIQLTPTIGL